VAQEKVDELRALEDSLEGDLEVRETLLDLFIRHVTHPLLPHPSCALLGPFALLPLTKGLTLPASHCFCLTQGTSRGMAPPVGEAGRMEDVITVREVRVVSLPELL